MFNPENYTIISHLLPKIFGLIYFFAIWPFLFQIKGLIGSNGILPAYKFLSIVKINYPFKRYLYVPTLFWISSGNRSLIGIVFTGIACSIALILGYHVSLMLILLYVIYLSIVSVGQTFLSFGWEGFLLEATIYTFLVSLTATQPSLVGFA